MGPEDESEQICRRMAELRRELAIDVRDVGRSARAMTDPSYYLRKFPWAAMAVTAAVGYVLVPKKKQGLPPDVESLAELVRKQQVRLDASSGTKDSQGMLKSLAVMGLTWAARSAMKYMVEQLTTAATNKNSESTEQAEPAESPVEEPWKPTH